MMRKYSCFLAHRLLFHHVLNVFENKKGIIKILVYGSVIDINQMDVIFFATIVTSD